MPNQRTKEGSPIEDRTLQKWLTAFAAESYKAIVKALNEDGVIGEKQLKVHFDIIRKTEKNIGEIPIEKVVDFRLLREVRRELSGK